MNTDTDALAAYAEAWKPGDPLPNPLATNGASVAVFLEGLRNGVYHDWWIKGICQALTGVLVVELARRPAKKGCYPDDILYWTAKGLPGVVRLWLEVNK